MKTALEFHIEYEQARKDNLRSIVTNHMNVVIASLETASEHMKDLIYHNALGYAGGVMVCGVLTWDEYYEYSEQLYKVRFGESE